MTGNGLIRYAPDLPDGKSLLRRAGREDLRGSFGNSAPGE